MKLYRTIATLALIIMVSACSLTRNDTDRWLDSKKEPTTIDMTGDWTTGGGWGSGRFVQDGRNFTGTMGMYYAEGVVSGEQIYLVLYSGKKVYYTAVLKKSDSGEYLGKALYRVIADDPDARHEQVYPISMKRVNRQN